MTRELPSDTDLPEPVRKAWVRPALGVFVAILLVLDVGLEPHPYFAFQKLPFFDVIFGIAVSLGGLAVAFLLWLMFWRAEVYDDD